MYENLQLERVSVSFANAIAIRVQIIEINIYYLFLVEKKILVFFFIISKSTSERINQHLKNNQWNQHNKNI